MVINFPTQRLIDKLPLTLLDAGGVFSNECFLKSSELANTFLALPPLPTTPPYPAIRFNRIIVPRRRSHRGGSGSPRRPSLIPLILPFL